MLLASAPALSQQVARGSPDTAMAAAGKLLHLLVAHGAHHVEQIQQLNAKQYAQEAQTGAEMTKHMYVIADTLAGAIAQQFPAKFA